ncbi:hypothetical protein CB0940_05910, partial [Cercospora beticola]
AALANPVAELQARQLDPAQSSSCSTSHTARCTSTLLASARNFCAALGYGTTVVRTSTSRTTTYSTILRTTTVTPRIVTVTAPTPTTTSTGVATRMTTVISTASSTTTFSTTITDLVTEAIAGCPVYVPSQTQQDTETSTTTSSTTSTSSTVPPARALSCRLRSDLPQSGLTCGVKGAFAGSTRLVWQGDVNDGQTLTSIEACALRCRTWEDQRLVGESGQAGCKSFYWGQGRMCQLNVVGTSDSGFGSDANSWYSGNDLGCYECAREGGSTTTTTTTARTTTSSSPTRTTTIAVSTTTSKTRAVTTSSTTLSSSSRTTTTASTTTTTARGASCSSGSSCGLPGTVTVGPSNSAW